MYRSAKQSRSGSLSRKRRLIALTAAVSLFALLFTACDSSKELQQELLEIKNEIVEMKNDIGELKNEIGELKKIEDEKKSEETEKALEERLEATDAANIRSAYAVIQTAALMQDDQDTIEKNNNTNVEFTVDGAEGSFVYTAVVQMKQTQNEWQAGDPDIGGIDLTGAGTVQGGGTCTITYTQSTNATTIQFG